MAPPRSLLPSEDGDPTLLDLDFLTLAGATEEGASFECSSTVDGVSGSLCVTDDGFLLRGPTSSARIDLGDVRSWQATVSGATFSLAVEAGSRHTVTLLSRFHAPTVVAMTRAAGAPARLSA
ncbi:MULTISPECIES: hypothetical protein [unclassified Rathayibacter]|uniref:hypothetical protein n=1 Tax=unclassified Rathayibacter TaxID=2609250 RepID=UPI00188AD405|nr:MULTISPECIES: hypothetical protein [unclassified Rathayibacter]MBF4461176.1 hypothetical protein [Rathayibacter sp. VKM Ac-2879]MBF4502587.1 hypothetical protein [Rathayibacter sp. VKM Ac-2878]